MGFIEDSFVKAKEVIDIAGRKTNEVISLQKLRVNVSSIQSQISKNYEALGRLYYEAQNCDTINEDAIAALMAEIDLKKKELSDLEEKIALATGIRICPDCATSNPNTALYCNNCGQKLTAEEKTESSTEPAAESAGEEPKE